MVQNGNTKEAVSDSISDHDWISKAASTNIWKANSQYNPQDGDAIQTPRIWIKTVYGICLNTDCQK
jgi:hypothetical protein